MNHLSAQETLPNNCIEQSLITYAGNITCSSTDTRLSAHANGIEEIVAVWEGCDTAAWNAGRCVILGEAQRSTSQERRPNDLVFSLHFPGHGS